jgi:hypothetical protein
MKHLFVALLLLILGLWVYAATKDNAGKAAPYAERECVTRWRALPQSDGSVRQVPTTRCGPWQVRP